eukprot:6473434-Amphidinium_carterae.1
MAQRLRICTLKKHYACVCVETIGMPIQSLSVAEYEGSAVTPRREKGHSMRTHVEDPDSSADFTEEELRLEREVELLERHGHVEQALNELEACPCEDAPHKLEVSDCARACRLALNVVAVESAMAAMRLRLENAVDDERTSSKDWFRM